MLRGENVGWGRREQTAVKEEGSGSWWGAKPSVQVPWLAEASPGLAIRWW